MDFKGKSIEEWMLKQPASKFPPNVDYRKRYSYIKDNLRASVQNKIMVGELSVERNDQTIKQTSLTGHGPEHFDLLIKVVTDLLASQPNCTLSAYETFLLVSAIQMHDIGNILGRVDHQHTAFDVFYDVIPAQDYIDSIEVSIFNQISEAHTSSEGEKLDTIGDLKPAIIKHKGYVIRQQLLAAILRFSDELTDDPSRAFTFGLRNNLIVEESKVFHEYCNALTSTHIDGSKISIEYKFEEDKAKEKFILKGKEVFLLEVIFGRNVKMYLESLYCQKFMRPDIVIDIIDINIEVYSDKFKRKLYSIHYRMVDRGYPSLNESGRGILDLCEDENQLFCKAANKMWSGQVLFDLLTTKATNP